MRPSFSSRADLTECMDEPDCSETQLLRTIQQLASVNRLVSRYRSILKREVLSDMLRQPNQDYHLVDLGAGGCDIGAWLLRAAHRHGLHVRVTACDSDPRTVRYAESIYAGTPGLTIVQRDVLTQTVEAPVDYLFANHFLHHLSDADAEALLRLWAPRVRRRMVISDLHRSRSSYAAFSVLSLVYRGSFTRQDGLISIRRGFRTRELLALAASAGLGDRATAYRLLPGRVALLIDGYQDASRGSKRRKRRNKGVIR